MKLTIPFPFAYILTSNSKFIDSGIIHTSPDMPRSLSQRFLTVLQFHNIVPLPTVWAGGIDLSGCNGWRLPPDLVEGMIGGKGWRLLPELVEGRIGGKGWRLLPELPAG